MRHLASTLLATLACVAAARAQEAINTFYGPTSSSYYQLLHVPTQPQFWNHRAALFTSQASGEVTSITIPAFVFAAASTPAMLSLYEAQNEQVGSLVGQVPVTLTSGGHTTPPRIFPTPNSGIHLTAGGDYFFALSFATNTELRWFIYGPPYVGTVMAGRSQNGAWIYNSGLGWHTPAFAITVPAPAAAALLAFPLARRRRRGSSPRVGTC